MILKRAKCKDKHGRDMRYHAEWLLECLLLRIKSPKCYMDLYQEKTLPLPSKSVLNDMASAISRNFGINDFAFRDLEAYMKNKPLDLRYCSLIWDEITLAAKVLFDTSSYQFEGFVDRSQGDTEFDPEENREEPRDERLANHALVFIVQPYIGHKIQTIGVFNAKGVIRGADLYRLVMKALFLLEDVGAPALSTVCDGE